MNPDTPWESARWRNEQYPRAYHASQSPAAVMAAPTAINPVAQTAIVDSYGQGWAGRARSEVESHHIAARGRPSTMQSHHAATHKSRSIPRQSSPSSSSGKIDPRPTTQSPHPSAVAAWRSSSTGPQRQHTGMMTDGRAVDVPLTLHIPSSDSHAPPQDFSRLAPARNSTPHEPPSYGGPSAAGTPQPTSLPSFASFRESASRPDEDEVEIAPMSSRLSCYQCTKLTSMLSEVAMRVAELDENIQSHCNRSVSRPQDFPRDSAVRTAEWILSRIQYSKGDLQDASQRQQAAVSGHQPSGPYSGMLSHRESPILKRRADGWDESSAAKRFRPGDSPDSVQHMVPVLSIKDDRRPSFEYTTPSQSQPRSGYSPPASESVPGSAYPRNASPGRQGRALPSPSSMVYPASAAPSLAPPMMGSPSASYQNAPSASPATTAHIADLQHQVSLKSLELQTLQSEYGSLLQKLQRERVKSQTIERKTSVADREVNDLTNRNEELTDQVKMLQQQLDDSEKKRDDVFADAKREKDQWTRMLDMSGRLQSKHADERQKLVEENARLIEKLRVANSGGEQHLIDARKATSEGFHGPLAKSIPQTDELPELQRENEFLKARLDSLRQALENAQASNQDTIIRMQTQNSRIGSALGQATYSGSNTNPSTEAVEMRPASTAAMPEADKEARPHVAANTGNKPTSSLSLLGTHQTGQPGQNNSIKLEPFRAKRDDGSGLFRPVNLPSTPFADASVGHVHSNAPDRLRSSPGTFTDRSSPSNSGGSPDLPEASFQSRLLTEKGIPSISSTAVFGSAPSPNHLERGDYWHRHAQLPREQWGSLAMTPPPARLV